MSLAIGPNTCIRLHFSLGLDTGEIIDSTFERAPAQFVFGDGNLLLGFENALVGLIAGQSARFKIPPEQAFGAHNPNNIQTFKRQQFGPDIALEVGLLVSFADAQQAELAGVISHIDGDTLSVDFNHPLAGRVLDFNVQILDVTGVNQ